MSSTFLVDTHCHLDLFPDIQGKVKEVDYEQIKTITVTNVPSVWRPNHTLFSECKNIRVALGLHPELAHLRESETSLYKELINRTKYVGEIGLDGTNKDKVIRNSQKRVFDALLTSLRFEAPKILTIHSRGSSIEVIDELEKFLKDTPHKVILHWYTGGLKELRKAIELGFYFSFNHKMIISKSGLRILQELPSERVLTETDAPFTFDINIKDRLSSLNFTMSEIAKKWAMKTEDVKSLIFSNFSELLQK